MVIPAQHPSTDQEEEASGVPEEQVRLVYKNLSQVRSYEIARNLENL